MMDDSGKIIFKAFSFSNTSDGADALLSSFPLILPTLPILRLAWKLLAIIGFLFYSFLYGKGFLIHVINPIQTDGWRKGVEIRKRKNDIIDSILIADLIRYGQFVETRLSDEDIFPP